jgi:hypothetical protein
MVQLTSHRFSLFDFLTNLALLGEKLRETRQQRNTRSCVQD